MKQKIGSGSASGETTTSGNASVRLEIRRIGSVKCGEEVTALMTRSHSAASTAGRFGLLQQFETALDIVGDEFHARFRDLTVPANPDETAWLAFADVMDDHVPLAKGALFYGQLCSSSSRTATKERLSGTPHEAD